MLSAEEIASLVPMRRFWTIDIMTFPAGCVAQTPSAIHRRNDPSADTGFWRNSRSRSKPTASVRPSSDSARAIPLALIQDTVVIRGRGESRNGRVTNAGLCMSGGAHRVEDNAELELGRGDVAAP